LGIGGGEGLHGSEQQDKGSGLHELVKEILGGGGGSARGNVGALKG
jgi:hypothetical protein